VDPSQTETICQLKFAYFRLLDLKRFDELGDLLTADATTAYQSGELRQDGRDAIVAFLQESLGDPGIITMHNGHHPEIELIDENTATGRWYLEDRVIVPAHDFELHGTALYADRSPRSTACGRSRTRVTNASTRNTSVTRVARCARSEPAGRPRPSDPRSALVIPARPPWVRGRGRPSPSPSDRAGRP
jgi:hypothetical protein